MAITAEEIEREKKTLPFGWGRFRKSYDGLTELSEPDESLLASGVALNPEFKQGRFVPGTIPSVVSDLTGSTNVLVACTSKRLILLKTGIAGGARKHISIPYEGMEIAERAKHNFVLTIPQGRVKIKNMAKQQQPRFLEVLEAQLHPTPAQSA